MGKPAARLMDMTAHGGMITGPGCPTVLIGKMPAARMTDMHVCPMTTGPVPHVGGPLVGPVPPTVFIGKLPAACMGDMAICVGPPATVLPPGCPTVLLGQSGGGGGGGGGGSASDASSASPDSATAPSTIDGADATPLQIQQQLAQASQYMDPTELKLLIQVINDTYRTINAGNDSDDDAPVELTIADIVDILEGIERDEGYEAARFFATRLDYGKLTEMAKAFISGEDDDSNNDPNLMPTRFMLLYGMDDNSLSSADNHPDNFENAEAHVINIENLRKGLKLLGYEVADSGSYDDEVYVAHMQYLSKSAKSPKKFDTTHVVEEGESLGTIAADYGLVSWKYLYEINNEAIGDNPDLLKAGTELEIPQWDNTTGDEKIKEKDADPWPYVNGLQYRYPWVAFSVTLVDDDENRKEDFEEAREYIVYNITNDVQLETGDIQESEDLKLLIPDSKDIIVGIDGYPYEIDGKVHRHPNDSF